MFSEEEGYASGGNPFANLLSTAVGLSPAVFAGASMMGTVRANSAVNPATPFGVGRSAGGNIPAVARAIGQSVQSGIRNDRTGDLQRLKALTDQIMQADNIQKMFSNISEQNALIQSILTAIDDPGSGLHDVLLGYKEKLLALARDQNSEEALRDTIKEVVKAINTQGNENSRVRWERNFREFRKLGASLTPPTLNIDAGQSYTHVEASALSGAAKKRYQRLVAGLGDAGSSRVSIVERMFAGGKHTYARVFSGGAGRSSYQATIPLDITRHSSGLTPVFMGRELQTAYAAPQMFLKADQLSNAFANGRVPAYDDIQKAQISVEDLFINRFLGMSRGGKLDADAASQFGNWQRQFMEVMPRIAYAGGDLSITSHLQKVFASVSNIATVVGLGRLKKEEQERIMTQLGSSPALGFEAFAPGYQFMVNGIGDEPIGRVGLHRNSALGSLRTTSVPDRGMFPVESRIEQVWGRQSLFVGHGAAPRKMGRGGTMDVGATSLARGASSQMVGKNIEWADALTGATNKAVLLDFNGGGGVVGTLSGQGAALYAGRDTIRSFTTKPILNPSAHGYMGSKLLEHILPQIKPGEFMELTQEMLDQHGTFLGFSPNGGAQHIRESVRTQKYHIGYEAVETYGKQQLNIILQTQKRAGDWKGFSTMFKGVLHSVSSRHQFDLAEKMGFSRNWLKSIGIGRNDLVIAPADMMKKGAGFFDLQMSSAYGLVSGDKDWRKTLRGLAQTGQYAELSGSKLQRVTGAVIKALSSKVKEGKVSTTEMGQVLAGIYTAGSKMSLQQRSQIVQKDQIKAALMSEFGQGMTDQILSVAGRGYGIAATSMTQGMGVEDYGLGRGSIEPRTIKVLQGRLQMMGMGPDQAAEIIAGMYKQKVGHAGGIKSAQGMLRMLQGLTGTAGLAEGLSQVTEGLPTYNLSDLSAITGDGGFDAFLRKNQNGFLFDFTSGADTEVKRAISAHARDLFGQGQMFIPGADVADAMRDVSIKRKGEVDQIVHGEYTRMMGDFFGDLSAATTQSVTGVDASRNVLSAFKKNAIGLASRTILNVSRGKIKGLQSMIAKVYDLDAATTIGDPRKLAIARGLTRRAKGQAIFMDKAGFLSQLNDWMGSSPSNKVAADAAKKAEMFFMGSFEAHRTGDIGKAKGIFQFAMRHPLLSLGNIAPVQMFRHLDEIGRDDREIFDAVARVNDQWKGVRSWHNVASMKAGQRHAFFKDFVKQVGELAPEGGGSMYFPKSISQVNVAGVSKPFEVDMGVAGAALGDFDGDQWMSMMLNQEAGKQILSNLKQDKMWGRTEALYKIKSEIFAEEAKKGLERIAGEPLEFASKEMIKQGMLKEQRAKDAVGSLDVKLTQLRTSLLDLKAQGKAGASAISDALALLKIIQEHAVIKGKKLPVSLPFAEQLSAGVNYLFETGSVSSFEHVLKEKIFVGSGLWDGMTIDSVNSPYEFASGIKNESVGLRSVLDTIQEAARVAKITGVHERPSEFWLTKQLEEGSPAEKQRAMAILNAGESLESGLIHEAGTGKSLAAGAEVMGDRIMSVLRNADKNMIGMGVAGVLGSLAVMGTIFHQGYAPQPMVMPGEMTSPDVRAAMGRGDLFSRSPERVGGGTDAYATFNRVQNTPTTYISGPSAYQIRGEVPSVRSAGLISDYMGTLGNSTGSLRVNDTRSPLTANYFDRAAGEY